MPGYRAMRGEFPPGNLYLSSAGGWASTPDAADLHITGDIDIQIECFPDNRASGAIQLLIAKWAGSNAFRLSLDSVGYLQLYLTDGTTTIGASSSVKAPAGRNWFRATWRQSDGRVQFFRSADGSTWTQLGADQVISLTAINAGTSALEVGSYFSGTQRLAGIVYAVRILNGIGGTTVVDADFSAPASNFVMAGTTYHDGTRLWTINGTGWAWK